MNHLAIKCCEGRSDAMHFEITGTGIKMVVIAEYRLIATMGTVRCVKPQ